MDWARDLPGWSLSAQSERIVCGPHRWHVQTLGAGPELLLLPGAGSSTHTWRALIPQLAEHYQVRALDLPGQGFTQSPNATRSGLDEMVTDITALCHQEGWAIQALIGHSAGAAIALGLSRTLAVRRVVGINPALDHFEGVAGWLFPALARLLAANPFTANLFTLGASRGRARRLIEGTGSEISDEGLSFYTRLISDKTHVNGALQMMARWKLDGLLSDLPDIAADTLFLTGSEDAAVPPKVAGTAAERLPHARVVQLDGLGHLAHEEDPERVLSHILRFLEDTP